MSSARDEVIALDRRHVWRPYTSSLDHERRDPFVVREAKGVHLTDMDGRSYIDGNGSWWVNNLGHGHPRLIAALERQASTLAHCALAGITHEPAARLAAALADVAPAGLDRVFYSDDGSTAVEVAIKMAYQFFQQNGAPGRRRFIAFPGAFHGDTLGAVSVGGIGDFTRVFGPLLFDVVRPPEPDSGIAGWERVIAHIEHCLEDRADEVAAVIVEPMLQGAAGMRVWPASGLRRLRAATSAAGALLIADEVFTGYGRTGAMWGCDHAQVTPDILCTAKAFSDGILPFAATLTTSALFDGFRGDKTRALMHGHSYCGNPLACAVALEVLAIYRDEDVVAGVRDKARAVTAAFDAMATIPGVRRPRSIGLVGAVDLGDGGYHGELGWRVHEEARRLGVYLRPLGDTVYVAPALVIAPHDLDVLLGSVREAVAVVMERG